MAALSAVNPTFLDLANALDPQGNIMPVAEILHQTNEILADATVIEGNMPTGHRHAVRTGIPQATWRKFYGGVQPVKSTRAQVTDNCGMLENYAEVDKALADLNGNTAEFRLSEDVAILEGMNQQMATQLFYGSETSTPERFTGFAPRFNSLAAANAENVISAGTVTGGDAASIWLIVWSPMTCHCIIPKGSMAGVQRKDLGEVTIENVDGAQGRMQAYRTHYRWDLGLAVPDWRYVVRCCNIDKSALLPDASSGPNLPQLMFQMMEQIPNLDMGRPAFYMSRTIRRFLRQQLAYATENSTLSMGDVGGRRTLMFQDIPLRRCDALAADETTVS